MIETTLQERVQARVARGVKWLNRRYPNWHKTIEVKRFDFRDPCCCVLGQVCPAKNADETFAEPHLRKLGLNNKGPTDASKAHGFDWGAEDHAEQEADLLQQEWIKQIAIARREARRCAPR